MFGVEEIIAGMTTPGEVPVGTDAAMRGVAGTAGAVPMVGMNGNLIDITGVDGDVITWDVVAAPSPR